MNRREHWESIYRGKGDAELSWFQAHPATSLSLIDSLVSRPRCVIDVGGGQSALAGELLARGIENVTVLDISSAAIDRAKTRLGPLAGRVRWVVGDVLESPDLGSFDLWHDRAVFHFLTDATDRRKYCAAAARAVAIGGHAIISTFAPTGPEKCSGLSVRRYDASSLTSEFLPSFRPVTSTIESHATPWGKPQNFTYAVLRRDGTELPDAPSTHSSPRSPRP